MSFATFPRIWVSALAITGLVVACGARTGFFVADIAAPADAQADVVLPEAGVRDAASECSDAGAYCDPTDLSAVYSCGARVASCNALEQCARGACRNPCVDTLGQDTSNGCEFYAVEADLTDDSAGVCYAVFVVNQWRGGEAAKLEVDLGGVSLPISQFARIPAGIGPSTTYQPFNAQQGLPKDQVAVLFLSRDPAAAQDPNPTSPRRLAGCPAGVTPAVPGDAALHGTGRGKAFHITSNVPVVAYQMLPYGAGRARITAATLLLPTNVWGDNYLAVNGYGAPPVNAPRVGPTLAIIGQEDNTTVNILPTSDLLGGGGLSATGALRTGTYTINRGEYLQFTQKAELTGSAIQSNKPVGLIGGSTLMNVPASRIRADSAHQMLFPVSALGSEYPAVRYRSRDPNAEESVPWRIIGAVDGTQLTYDPPQQGAPASINARAVAEFESDIPFVVRSQDSEHPFYFVSYMTGGEPYDGQGDPEFVNVVAPAQYLPRYTFFTDPTYPETNLVIVRAFDQNLGMFPDVKLDCAGTLTGWKPIGADHHYEYRRVDLSTGNFQGVAGCDNGVHTIEGTLAVDGSAGVARFGVTVWGWGSRATWAGNDEDNPKFTRWVSYGYPAGANVAALNKVVLGVK